jgi:hypothetical protein
MYIALLDVYWFAIDIYNMFDIIIKKKISP